MLALRRLPVRIRSAGYCYPLANQRYMKRTISTGSPLSSPPPQKKGAANIADILAEKRWEQRLQQLKEAEEQPRARGVSEYLPDAINCKPSLAPEINLPVREPGTGFWKHYFAMAKEYLRFFKEGLMGVLRNYNHIQKDILAVKGVSDSVWNTTFSEIMKIRSLTRSEVQLIKRTNHDLIRIPIFGLIVILAGELSLFILPFCEGIVPYRCRPPILVERQRRKLKEFRKFYDDHWRRNLFEDWPDRVFNGNQQATSMTLKYLGIRPYWFKSKTRQLHDHLAYLVQDDELILRYGGYALLEGEELRMTAEERGVETYGKTDFEIHMQLAAWVKLTRQLGAITFGMWTIPPECRGKTRSEMDEDATYGKNLYFAVGPQDNPTRLKIQHDEKEGEIKFSTTC